MTGADGGNRKRRGGGDVHTPQQRSHNMSRIRGTNTKPEILVRKSLFARGFRYRLHHPDLPGHPDIVFPRYRAVVLVHGCFWHGHGCHLFRWPESNREFWRGKIGGNMARDARTREELLALGWRVLTVWECALKGTHRLPADEVAIRCEHWLWSGLQQAEIAGSAAGGEEATICNV